MVYPKLDDKVSTADDRVKSHTFSSKTSSTSAAMCRRILSSSGDINVAALHRST